MKHYKEKDFYLLIIALLLYNSYQIYKELNYKNFIIESEFKNGYVKFIQDENIRKYIENCIKEAMDQYFKNNGIILARENKLNKNHIENSKESLNNNNIRGYIENIKENEHIKPKNEKLMLSQNMINNKFSGCNVSMLTSTTNVSGEIVFDFNDLVCLKSLDGTIYVKGNSMDILFSYS